MPGRHERQRVVRKKSRSGKPAASPMERMVTDSYYNRNRKEQSILAGLVPVQRMEVKKAGTLADKNRSFSSSSADVKKQLEQHQQNSSSTAKRKDEKKVAATLHPTKTQHWTNEPLQRRLEKKKLQRLIEKQQNAEGEGVKPSSAASATDQQQSNRQQKTTQRAKQARASAESLLAGLAGGK